ncbi:hypothetical protein RJT34_08207 [Clitoria ternatea]|uniref:Uncharacterized protein n=1 Tax=Clitoria ternatea TaxID=43366 RepID=A0AAN9K694_CLITE
MLGHGYTNLCNPRNGKVGTKTQHKKTLRLLCCKSVLPPFIYLCIITVEAVKRFRRSSQVLSSSSPFFSIYYSLFHSDATRLRLGLGFRFTVRLHICTRLLHLPRFPISRFSFYL